MEKIKPILRKFLSLKFIVPIIVVMAIIAVVAGVYFFMQYQKAQKQLSSPPQLGVAESQQIVNKISKLIELPTDEQPSVATVSDINKLKDQPFFKNAKNGDNVLIYTQNKKAIIYRSSTNKIIEVAPVNLGSNTESAQNPSATTSASGQVAGAAVTPTPKIVRVALYNGTTIVGYTKTIEERIKAKYSNIEVSARENASKSDYVKTIVVDINKNPDIASALAKDLSGEVGSLPSGETKPKEADILIILGSSSE